MARSEDGTGSMPLLRLALVLATSLALQPAIAVSASDISSAYTKVDFEKGCTTFAAPEDGEGDWANSTCDGYKGYPALVYYGDARESWYYGFPKSGDLAPRWESFGGFNAAGDTIEWRIMTEYGLTRPFATIRRWFVSRADDSAKQDEVLVVTRVGQPGEADGCVIGYVMATGNPGANEQAREMADTKALSFVCGSTNHHVREGSVKLPATYRHLE